MQKIDANLIQLVSDLNSNFSVHGIMIKVDKKYVAAGVFNSI